MTVTLITGANKGLGYESARRLLTLGHTVYVTARDPSLGQEAASSLGARFVQLDVTSDDSVAAAAETVLGEAGHLDVLVNNAGIVGGRSAIPDVTGADAMRVFDTNVAGVVRVTHAFLPLLEKSTNPVIVNVSSGLGSFAVTQDPTRMESRYPTLLYSASKAAVVMLTTQYAKALPGMRINVCDPGYTSTDLNSHNGTQTVQEGTDAIVALATIDTTGPTGTFIDRFGPVAW
jgi:NAD(P)-dependent dehydrogenase (short-subunit alcohol dehydrogenase family)